MKTLAERSISASLIILGSTGCYYILSIVTQSLIGHKSGPVALGRYSAILMAIEFVAVFILLGTPSALNRFTSLFMSTGRQKETKSLLSGLLFFLVVVSLGIDILVVILFDFLQKNNILDETLRHDDLLFIIIGSTAFSLSRSFSVYYHADYKNIKGSLISIAAPLTTFVLVILNYARFIRITLVQIVSIGFAASALFSIVMSAMKKDLSVKPQWNLIRDLVIFSFPLFGVSIVAFFSAWVDRIIVGLMSNIENMGILTAAVIITRAIRFIPQALTPVFVTSYSRVVSISEPSRKLSAAFSMDLFFVSLFCLGIASTIYMWAQFIIHLLWGANFGRIVVTILRIELFGLIGLAHSLQTPNFLVVMGRPRLNLRLASMQIILQLILSIILLKAIGIAGIALASAITLIIMAFFRHKIITHNLGIDIQIQPLFMLIASFALSVAVYHVVALVTWVTPIIAAVVGNLFAMILLIVSIMKTPFAFPIIKYALKKIFSLVNIFGNTHEDV